MIAHISGPKNPFLNDNLVNMFLSNKLKKKGKKK